MTTRALLLGGISALLLGGTMVGCAANGGGIASASDRNAALATKGAAGDVGQAQAALARNDGPIAIGYAERAVALMPQQADYRMLLGQSYLKGGRFASASHAFADALQLSPTNGRAALNLALSQIATGDWQSARHSLEANAAIIPAVDRGLALSLAGDTAGGIAVLTEAARSPASNAKIRQNLALSFALAGRWQEARVVAAADMAPADVDARLEQWALFAQPAKASDQVASLLGVRAVPDAGQPVALALNAPAPGVPEQALAAADPVIAPTEVAPVQIASVSAAGVSKIAFGPRQEVVQALPTMMLRPSGGPIKVASAPVSSGRGMATAAYQVKAPATGNWYVQLGAFESAGVARDGWARAARRFAVLASYSPNGMTFKAKGEDVYRLSVGGFSKSAANAMCRQYHAKGGACFVRQGAGDVMAQWLRKPGMQLASR
ncbi:MULTISPECIES: SPOR domain-containing protein [unclassified Sphingomonas]|uniref:SPOR domain-containing protein n=1 Tax=unclassified Sphingomonas TaxID=196159 RepID=UPI000E75A39D|nr:MULTISPECIES: SPOR domain-containing protein [unclassified Sphingomonas]RKE50008.1 anaphase-promoting complex subunit 3 [Sphingomonas sp. PP-CC-1A-547]TCM08340.1 anaphase-promoting complex subunit 3 [Sphingomonas sp. PP-CC-3G-468]